MSDSETGKQRQIRIDLRYYKRPDPIARWRSRLVLLALTLAGVWFGLAPYWDRESSGPIRYFGWDRLASPGPLARVHSTWESRCEACHVPFRAVNSSRWSPLSRAGARVSDRTCQACHAGPPHHASQLDTEVSACADCHRDHRGRESSLVRIEDTACTSCHADLNKHRGLTASHRSLAVADSVTHFDDDPTHHPEFAAVRRGDPGRLRFNHALHLAKGFTLEPGGKEFTFVQVAQADRARYGWAPNQSLGAPVPKLDCAACHQLDGGEYGGTSDRPSVAGAVIPGRNNGAYMLPVTYENHCRACHPLEFDAKSPGRQLQHRLSSGLLLEELRQFYAAQALGADPELLRRFIPPRPKPGAQADPALGQVGRAVDDRVLSAVRILFGSAPAPPHSSARGGRGCLECHHLSPSPGPLVRPDAIRDISIEPVNAARVWLDRAVFDHSAHRALACAACHAAATTSEKSSDLLLPGIASCVQCHGPATDRGGKARGGAGSSCTECHRYHNGDHPHQGLGTSARGVGVDERRTIEEFLGGARTRRSP